MASYRVVVEKAQGWRDRYVVIKSQSKPGEIHGLFSSLRLAKAEIAERKELERQGREAFET